MAERRTETGTRKERTDLPGDESVRPEHSKAEIRLWTADGATLPARVKKHRKRDFCVRPAMHQVFFYHRLTNRTRIQLRQTRGLRDW